MAEIKAPMPGVICDIKVNLGDTVIEDQEILTMEAMKMEMPIASPAAGKIAEIKYNKGDAVQGGDLLIVID